MPDPRRARLAVAAVFFVNGMSFGTWVPRIPAVKDQLGLDIPTLGLVLLSTGLGGMVGSAISGYVVPRLGSRRAAVGAGLAVAVVLPLVAIAPNPLLLAAVLFLAGGFDAITDIGMNAQAVALQVQAERSMMNRFHATWSLGNLAGSAGGAAAAAVRLPVGWHLLLTGGLAVIVLAAVARHLLQADAARDGARWREAMRLPALALGGAAFTTAIAEGAPADWSAVFLSETIDASPGVAGLGFVGFTAAMLTGRLVADSVVDAIGRRRSVVVSLGVVGLGLALVVLSPRALVGIAGFFAMGFGVAALFPLLYGAAGTLPLVTPGAGMAVMSVGGRLGFLAGPPLIGLVSGAGGLRLGLAVVVGLALGVTALLSRR